MTFNSSIFLFAFLPLALAAYAVTPKRAKNYTLLVASLLFCAWSEPRSIWVILLSTAIAYGVGLWLSSEKTGSKSAGLGTGDNAERAGDARTERTRRVVLGLAIAANVGLLAYFKYLDFFLAQLDALTNLTLTVHELILPLGISFFTFTSISYMIDIYRRQVPAQRNPLMVLLYLGMFSQITAGPIVRYQEMQPQLDGVKRPYSLNNLTYGAERFIIGLAKKLIIANQIGQLADIVFGLDKPSTPIAWLGALAYMLQIYFDFGGYCDMAIGLGHMLGFKIPENFNYPYITTSITGFWRRWHMTLSRWFRDYVYIPLGGNRRGIKRQLINMAIVWGLTGFWHGAKWTFLLWGLYYFVFLALEKTVLARLLERTPRWLRHIYALLIILFGWVLFRAETVDSALRVTRAMLSPQFDPITWSQTANYLLTYWPFLVLGILFSMPVYPWFRKKLVSLRPGFTKNMTRALGYLGLALLFVVTLMFLAQDTVSTFIYGKF